MFAEIIRQKIFTRTNTITSAQIILYSADTFNENEPPSDDSELSYQT